MSTDTENAQAAAEGYWPVEGHESHGIDAHAVKQMVADFIAKHSTPASLLAPLVRLLDPQLPPRLAPTVAAASDESAAVPDAVALDASAEKWHRRHERTIQQPIESANPADLVETPMVSVFHAVLPKQIEQLATSKPPEDVNPLNAEPTRRRR